MTTVQRQRASGVLFTAVGLVVAVAAVVNFLDGAYWFAGPQIAVAGFMGYLAWRQLQPTQEITVPTSDERTQSEAHRAASTAFWLLIIVLLIESSFDFIAPDLETSVYLLVAMGFLGLSWGYQKIPTK
jgi:hypothetical protein